MKVLLDRIATAHLAAMILLYIAVMALVFAQVVYRYLLRIGLPWSAEMAVAAFMWLIFLATAYGIREGSHFVVDVLPKQVPAPLDVSIRALSALAVLLAILILIYFGYLFTLTSVPSYSPALGISRAWIVASIPVSGVFALAYWIAEVRASFSGKG